MNLSRREWLISAGAFAISAPSFARTSSRAVLGESDELLANARGGYRFLPGPPFLSFATLASDGFEIVRATLVRPRLFPEGLTTIEKYLLEVGRPLHALCGLELRSGQQTTRAEFDSFNGTYIERVRKAGLLVAQRVPMTRTNVAMAGLAQHQIHAFSYTVPVSRPRPKQSRTFVLSAVPEVRNLASSPQIIAEGDTSLEGLRQKAAFILDAIENQLHQLALGWEYVTGIQLYTVHDLHPLMTSLIVPKLGRAARVGMQWYYARPPVIGGEIEMDVRATGVELTVDI